MDLYAENILEHSKNPRNSVSLVDATVSHDEENIACGDKINLELSITKGIIRKVGWSGEGCAISRAGMSILSDELIGKNEDDVLAMKKEDVYEMLGVPIGPRRFKCALMCLHCVKNALRKNRGLEPQGWLETVEINRHPQKDTTGYPPPARVHKT